MCSGPGRWLLATRPLSDARTATRSPRGVLASILEGGQCPADPSPAEQESQSQTPMPSGSVRVDQRGPRTARRVVPLGEGHLRRLVYAVTGRTLRTIARANATRDSVCSTSSCNDHHLRRRPDAEPVLAARVLTAPFRLRITPPVYISRGTHEGSDRYKRTLRGRTRPRLPTRYVVVYFGLSQLSTSHRASLTKPAVAMVNMPSSLHQSHRAESVGRHHTVPSWNHLGGRGSEATLSVLVNRGDVVNRGYVVRLKCPASGPVRLS